MQKPFYGLDFGTSNSTISTANEAETGELPVDEFMADACSSCLGKYTSKKIHRIFGLLLWLVGR